MGYLAYFKAERKVKMIQIKSNFSYGQKVKDFTTGAEGIVVAILKWKNGCVRIAIQPQMKKDSEKIPEAIWIDEMDLKGYKPIDEEFPGGPRTIASRYDIGPSK